MNPPFSSPYTVVSQAADGSVLAFVWQPGTESSRTIYACVQPLSARETRDLPEGLRTRAKFACLTYETLVSASTGGPLPDRVVVGGVALEVHGGFEDGNFPGAPMAGNDYILAAPEVK